jgi:hypothetical protein
MDKIVERLAQKLDRDWRASICSEENVVTFERVLRESKLPELIAAGQAMRDAHQSDNWHFGIGPHDAWDAALAAFLAATDSIPPSKL